MDIKCGKLYIVATPIGNLKDMSFRAIEVLKEVDIIAAEDTRHTRELLNHFDINTVTTSYHEHNKYDKAKEIIEKILNGATVAIVSDAGTPIISDPGDELVRLAIENNIEVQAVPGACAGINALVISGLPSRSFVFVGFLSDNNKKRKKQIDNLKCEMRTMIFYISPHNIIKDLKLLIEVFGDDRLASISREMTKVHEETIRGSLKSIYNHFNENDARGEFVLIVKGQDEDEFENEQSERWQEISVEDHFIMYQKEGFTDKEAMKKVACDRGVDKKDIYKILKVK